MTDAILALNAGSSSIKFGLFEVGSGAALTPVVRGEMSGVGGTPRFSARDGDGVELGERQPEGAPGGGGDHEALLGWLLRWVQAHLGGDRLVAVGHRVVHGGPDFAAPVRVDGDVLAALERLTPLAPLHQPHSLAPVRALMAIAPDLPQVACFDTAFHHTMLAVVSRLGLPLAYAEAGVRRYGFHGLSYEYIAGRLREIAPDLAAGRVIVAHLGSGASLCALQGGRSVDTTMGFSALDGLIMGTRCGSLDPGVVLYMLEARGLSAKEVERVLYHESGLLGISGVSSDMRELSVSSDPRAGEAIESFVFRIAREMAALVNTLGGLDGLVFTAGIGEHAPAVRAAVCARLGWLGVAIDGPANEAGTGRMSGVESRVEVWVVPTDEELMIAEHSGAVLNLM